jgi:hypothetical protein
MEQHNFLVKLGEKFRSKNLFTNAKNQMKKATRKYERQAIYSRVWQKLPVHQRKVLAHFRDKGVLLPNNTFENKIKGPSPPVPLPIPVNSPRTERRKNIESKFNNYWTKLTKNNRNTVRNYVARHKSVSPLKSKSPGFQAIDALKTAKARAEWLKARKLNVDPKNLKTLKNYVKQKDQNNRNKREAKRFKLVKI